MSDVNGLDKILGRLVELVADDPELKAAVVGYIQSLSAVNVAKAEWYIRRKL